MIKRFFIKVLRFDEQEWKEFYHDSIALLAVFLIGIAVITCCSCRSIKYVPITNDRTDSSLHYNSVLDSTKYVQVLRDTTYEIRWMVRDTIIRDSIYVIEKADGSKETNKEHFEKIYIHEIDSIYNKEYVESMKERYIHTLDSLYKIIDSKKEIPVEVEKPQSRWKRAFKVVAFIFVFLLILILSYKFLKKPY